MGKKFGPLMKQVAAAVALMSQEQIAELESNGRLTLDLAGTPAEIEAGEVEIYSEDIPGWVVANEGVLTVALDVTITDELRREGIARELVSKIQNIRKSSGFEITDRIAVTISSDENSDAAIEEHKAYICNQVLADSLIIEEPYEGIVLDFDGFTLAAIVEKI
jgi:isoleucyl-tRNA synthetase